GGETVVPLLVPRIGVEVGRVVELGRVDEQGDQEGVTMLAQHDHEPEEALVEEAQRKQQADPPLVLLPRLGKGARLFHRLMSRSLPARIAVASARRPNCLPTASDTSRAAARCPITVSMSPRAIGPVSAGPAPPSKTLATTLSTRGRITARSRSAE